MHTARRRVGVIYGNAGSTSFDLAVTDAALRRLDYVEVDHGGHRVLAQVGEVERRTDLSFDDALSGQGDGTGRLAATIEVVGYVDDRGLVQTPRDPFRAGTHVHLAEDALVTSVLGLEPGGGTGAYLGHVKGARIPVRLSLNALAQKHVSVLAKTGAGKSYTVGVLLEEFLKAGVPLVILDPHGEYGSLRHANIEEAELDGMVRFGIKPRSFAKQVREFALDTALNPDAEPLRLEGLNLEAHEISDLLGGRLSGGQMGVLYQAVKDTKEAKPGYTLRDVMEQVSANRSSAKWNVLNALESLASTGVFDVRGTPVAELVKPGQCTIVNLKGVAPDVQELAVTRLANLLWQTRKRNEVPPHILVVEEAHNFCPERGVGNAVSTSVLRTVASEGRKFGMGLVIVSQRPAKVDKNVLSQCNTQVVLKVTNPNDLKAIVQGVEGITTASADEVQRLPVGVALVAGGGLAQPVLVDVRPRHTRHGGRSIEVVSESDEAPARKVPQQAGGAHDVFTAPPRPARRRVPPPPEPEPGTAAPPAAVQHRSSMAVAAATEQVLGPEAPQSRSGPPGAARRERTAARGHRDAPAPGPGSPMSSDGTVREPADAASGAGVTPRPPSKWSKEDLRGIHRVAARIGLVEARQDPERAAAQVERIAEAAGEEAQGRLLLLREIAREVCHDPEPACIRCPERPRCQFHQALEQERRRTRSPIRRLWRR